MRSFRRLIESAFFFFFFFQSSAVRTVRTKSYGIWNSKLRTLSVDNILMTVQKPVGILWLRSIEQKPPGPLLLPWSHLAEFEVQRWFNCTTQYSNNLLFNVILLWTTKLLFYSHLHCQLIPKDAHGPKRFILNHPAGGTNDIFPSNINLYI